MHRLPFYRGRRFAGLAALLAAAILGSHTAPPVLAQPALEEFGVESGAEAGEMKTIAVVGLSGWTPLLTDIDYLGALAGKPNQAQSIEGMLNFFTQGKGLTGLDKTKPWGVLVQSNGVDFVPIVCLPINDLTAILELAQAFGVLADDAGGGVTELTVPNSPTPLFAKQQGEWVFVSQTAESLDNAPEDPSVTLADLVTDYDLGARGFVQNIPAMFREMAIGALRQGIDEGMQREPDESDEDFETRQKLAEMQLDQLVDMINGLDELTIGVAVNEAAGQGIVVDLAMTAVAGSDLAEQIAASEDAKTNFAGFVTEDATMQMSFASKTPAEAIAKQKEQIDSAIEVLRKQMATGIDEEADIPNEETREALKSAGNDLLDVYKETIISGVADGAMSMTVTADSFSMVGGAAIKSTEKVESALKKLAEVAADEPGVPEVVWNAESHAGVKFHTITLPIPAEARQEIDPFGETLDVAVGIGPEAVYLAAGADWLSAITTAIDESAAKGPTPTKPAKMQIALAGIAKMAAMVPQENQAMAQMFADALAQSDGDDHVIMESDMIENGARVRLQVEEGVIRAAASMAEAAARQAGAGGPPAF